MKTPEHWLHPNNFPDLNVAYADTSKEYKAWVEQIQQDAFLAGLKKASEIAASLECNYDPSDIHIAIFAEMDRVKAGK